MKRILILFFITVNVIIGGCANSSKLPEITIDQEKIDIIKLKEFSKDGKDLFIPLFDKKAAIEPKYIKMGEKVTLDFENNPPDKMTIQEMFLAPNGKTLYSDVEIKDISFTQEKNKYFFTIEESYVSKLSSVYFIGRKDLRGYKITTFTGKDKTIYICVIKTDAK